ncbi:FAD-dependent oxidoreductase [Mycobacterium sp. SMC-4]|uniref:FAD-dependent oxidoreductase n=1 Tax=Mycobacterium sp. SMC-4 TaxID=2857059 RepID=UPI003CFFC650
MPVLGERAVVLGASMSGLLAARVLAEFYRDVTLVERDELSDSPSPRRGVPQGRHPHALLARGAQTIGELFPGIFDDLVAEGAPVWDFAMSKIYICLNGHLVVRSGRAAYDDDATPMYQPSRPLLECHVRRRLRALPNVTIADGHEVTELCTSPDRARVTGVRLVDRETSAETVMRADLVVDAMGRAARTPALLDRLGYQRPVEECVTMHTTYMSQALRIPPGTLHEMLVGIGPAAAQPTGMFLVRNENDQWIFTVFGMGIEPPRDLPGMIAFARARAPEHVLAGVAAGEPLGPAVPHKLPSSQWRRYDKLHRFPGGLLVIGDAMCSFNPIYGQGMSVAATEATALREALRRGSHDVARRYFHLAAKSVGVAWSLGAGTDLAFPQVQGRRTPVTRLTQRYADWILTACETDALVHAQFTKVAGLVDPPARLFHPAFVRRVAHVNRARRQQGPGSRPGGTVLTAR